MTSARENWVNTLGLYTHYSPCLRLYGLPSSPPVTHTHTLSHVTHPEERKMIWIWIWIWTRNKQPISYLASQQPDLLILSTWFSTALLHTQPSSADTLMIHAPSGYWWHWNSGGHLFHLYISCFTWNDRLKLGWGCYDEGFWHCMGVFGAALL